MLYCCSLLPLACSCYYSRAPSIDNDLSFKSYFGYQSHNLLYWNKVLFDKAHKGFTSNPRKQSLKGEHLTLVYLNPIIICRS